MNYQMYLKKNLITESPKNASLTTTLQESLCCIGFGINQITKKPISIEDVLNSDLFSKSYQKYCDVDISESDIWEFANNKKDWIKSVVLSVNAGKKSKYLPKSNYTFYRTNGIMKMVYNAFNKLKKKDGVKLNNNKWNPGDIWASTISSIPQFNSLIELNQFISKSLKNGTLVGISLKKIKGSAKVTHEGVQDVEKVPVGYKSIKAPSRLGPFVTGINIITDKAGYKINFRSFHISKQADITGEVILKGSGARHGKVPSSLKKQIIRDEKISQMNKQQIGIMNDNQLKKIVQILWRDCGHSFSNNQIEKFWLLRLKKGIQDRIGYWQSLIHSIELGAFLNTNKGKADDIINKFFWGALSSSEFSSEFIKIY